MNAERVVHEVHDGARSANLCELPEELHPELLGALARAGIDQLYTHQREALEAAWVGPMIVTTGTASGKSLCFNLPALDTLCRDRAARALYLYPTKALAQDQARAIAALGLAERLRPAIYDGDTPSEARAEIRRRSRVVLTNPDMLHLGILPHHDAWADLFANLAAVVIDEAHVYRGVFGSHVANTLRRLRRISAAYGCRPRFLLASATLANPLELAERLTGLDGFKLIDRDGSPSMERRIAIWNPPLTDRAAGQRRSPLAEAAEILATALGAGARTICFVRSRRGVEVLSRLVETELHRRGDGELATQMAPYRAGYTAEQRRSIEQRLSSGELRAVITTDALELGIDVGALDAAIVVTYPGTVASLRQMWGRAGRRRPGLVVYVAGEDALDQFFCRHPQEFLDRPAEAAILDHESEQIHLAHLACAAYEGPLGPGDAEFFGPRLQAHAECLVERGELRQRGEGFVLRHGERYPAGELSLRSASPESFAIVEQESGELLGTTDTARVPSTLHEGAIYLHMGRSYHVSSLDLDGRRATVESFDGDWYTQTRRETATSIERLLDSRPTLGATVSLGRVLVTETVLAFERRRLVTHERIDVQALALPSTTFATQAIWLELPGSQLTGVPLEGLLGALHAAEHALIAVLPLIAMCDRSDIGGLAASAHLQTGGATIFIHDAHPGGVGIAPRAFECFDRLAADGYRLIAECGCDEGCPSCIQSPRCGHANEPLSKSGALELLGQLIAKSDTARTC